MRLESFEVQDLGSDSAIDDYALLVYDEIGWQLSTLMDFLHQTPDMNVVFVLSYVLHHLQPVLHESCGRLADSEAGVSAAIGV